MKSFIQIFYIPLFLLITSQYLFAWEWTVDNEGNYIINNGGIVSLGDRIYIAVCGNDGIVKLSSDDGITWIDFNIPEKINLFAINSSKKSTFVGGENGTLYSRDNLGGWQKIKLNTNETIRIIKFLDPNDKNSLGFILGTNGLALKTTDGGTSWEKMETGFKIDFKSILSTANDDFIIMMGKGKLLKSTDQGSSWSKIDIDDDETDIDFINGSFIDDKKLNIYGNWNKPSGTEIFNFNTSDNGNTWNKTKQDEVKGDLIDYHHYVNLDYLLTFDKSKNESKIYQKSDNESSYSLDFSIFKKLNTFWDDIDKFFAAGDGTIIEKQENNDTCKVTEFIKDTTEKLIPNLDYMAVLRFNYENYDKVEYILRLEYNDNELNLKDEKNITVESDKPVDTDLAIFSIHALKYGTFFIKVKYHAKGSDTCVVETVRVRVTPSKKAKPEYVRDGFDVSGIVKTKIKYRDSLYTVGFIATKRDIYSIHEKSVTLLDETICENFWEAPKGRKIVRITPKMDSANGPILILLDDGSVYRSDYSYSKCGSYSEPGLIGKAPAGTDAMDFYNDAVLDDYYIITSKLIFYSKDNGKSWGIDTTGLNNAYLNKLALYKNTSVFVGTSKGLFTQKNGDKSWTRVTSLPLNYINNIFTDRIGKIWVSGFSTCYMSSDAGKTWIIDTLGLNQKTISKFCDDKFGNMYATAESGTLLLTRDKSSEKWARAGNFFESANYLKSITGVITDISGDSLLYASSIFGLFRSSDQGKTWTDIYKGMNCNSLFNIIKNPASQNFLLTTNRGILEGKPSDSSWKKIFPPNGYQPASMIFADTKGYLYTVGEFGKSYSTMRTIRKSSDGGITWIADTTDGSDISGGLYVVDKNGKQYNVTNGGGQEPVRIYSNINNKWIEEKSNPFPFPGAYAVALKSYNNYVYISIAVNGQNKIFRRSISSIGDWEEISKMLNSSTYEFAENINNGQLFAGTNGNGVITLKNNEWAWVTNPDSVPQGASCFALTCDADGTLFAAFGKFDNGFQYHGIGTYFTNDEGKTWNSCDLEGINTTSLVTIGNLVWAITEDGLFSINKSFPSSINEEIASINNYFGVFPNPASEYISISYTSAGELGGGNTESNLYIYNAFGECVYTTSVRPADTPASGGQVRIDVSGLVPGVYFVRVGEKVSKFVKL